MENKNVVTAGAVVVIIIVVLAVGILIGQGSHTSNTKYTSVTQQTTQTVATSAATTSINSTHIMNQTNSTHMMNQTHAYTIQLETNASAVHGSEYLANAAGFTLYLYSQDTQGGNTSACYDQCAVYWPAFYAANLTLPPQLSPSKFGYIVRTGGQKQLTYRGYPLYTYLSDKYPGQVNGEGVAGSWLAVTYPNLTT